MGLDLISWHLTKLISESKDLGINRNSFKNYLEESDFLQPSYYDNENISTKYMVQERTSAKIQYIQLYIKYTYMQ